MLGWNTTEFVEAGPRWNGTAMPALWQGVMGSQTTVDGGHVVFTTAYPTYRVRHCLCYRLPI